MSRTMLGLLVCGVLGVVSGVIAADPVVYESTFSKTATLADFDCTDTNAWRMTELEGRGVLELHGKSKYKYKVRSPYNIALLATQKMGSFVLEAELMQTGKEYGHRDMCLFFNFQDRSNFYYVHIASVMDKHANNIFIVKDAPRKSISTKTNKGNDWGQEKWHKIRLVRDLEAGTIKLFFDDMETPIMEATDKSFGKGYVGFGSFDDTGMISNVKIMSSDAEKVEKTGVLFK